MKSILDEFQMESKRQLIECDMASNSSKNDCRSVHAHMSSDDQFASCEDFYPHVNESTTKRVQRDHPECRPNASNLVADDLVVIEVVRPERRICRSSSLYEAPTEVGSASQNCVVATYGLHCYLDVH